MTERDDAWKPSGWIALLTDFGAEDPYVGQMKAVIARTFEGARVIDLAHGVPPQDVRVGAFFLARGAPYFPMGTVFVAVVDPGVGTARRALVAVDRGMLYLAPDNGLLPAALSSDAVYRELDVERVALPARSRTFHGRDVFAPAAALLASGTSGRGIEDATHALAGPIVPGEPARARRVSASRVEAHVLFADRYGNLVLDATPEDLDPEPAAWRAIAAGRAAEFRSTYGAARSGELLALVDSFGSIELAVRDGSAERELGLTRGDAVVLEKKPC